MKRSAVFSDDKVYRYLLWRKWDESLPYVVFIGLNPSTADEEKDDQTIRRCIAFAQKWGYGSMCMVNLFAFRSTDPTNLKSTLDPIGPQNDGYIDSVSINAGIIIAAWGNNGDLKNRSKIIRNKIPGLHCLQITEKGEPNHPLYLSKNLMPFPLDQMASIKKNNTEKIANELKESDKKDILNLFVGQVLHIHQIFYTYRNIFENNKDTIINDSANHFFDLLYKLLTNSLILEISKITDKEVAFNQENLTIGFVANRLLKTEVRSSLEVETCLANVLQFGLIVSEARNKIIAHSDLKTFKNNSLLSEFDRNEIEQFFKSLSNFCDIASKEITGNIIGDIYTGRAGDELDLIKVLRQGLAYQKAFENGDTATKSYLFSLLQN